MNGLFDDVPPIPDCSDLLAIPSIKRRGMTPEMIAAGDACLSVREWMGAPYRSKQREIARLTKDDGIGLQQLTDIDTNAYCFYPCVRIENRDIDKVLVATNDGLSLDDWRQWFKNYDHLKPLAIIHFTNFRY